MYKKQASSQAAWALLMEGVTHARVDAHRLKHMINRAVQLIDASEDKERMYKVAGDIIIGAPKRLEHLEKNLDRTGLALSKMGSEFLSARLPLSDKAMVDEAVESAFGRPTLKDSDATRLAQRFMLAAIRFPNAPEAIQDILEKLDAESGTKLNKMADFSQWEFRDYSYITYRLNRSNYINVSGKKGSDADSWFGRYSKQFKMNIMNGGSGGSTQWQYKLK